ncbi:MAG: hypothetical protein JO076_02055 [Verrucomicrobia bacterium]|nr:hypothetical protein [Verrucomicrobiota bacterium]
MNAHLMQLTSAVLAGGLLLTGCENLSPGANGALFGAGAGALAGGIAKAAGASDTSAVAIGLATGAAVGVAAYVIAKHEATERQRRVAEERARLAYQQMQAQARRTNQPQQRTRYIAVDTARESNSTGARSVMVFDTQTQQVVGNNVYDVKEVPKEGTVTKFDTISAEYVGSGT